jgi:hypothetical protein
MWLQSIVMAGATAGPSVPRYNFPSPLPGITPRRLPRNLWFRFNLLPYQVECLLRHVYRPVYLQEKPFKSVLRAFLHHVEHKPHQLFERHFALPGEILCAFLRAAFIFRRFYQVFDFVKNRFFPC